MVSRTLPINLDDLLHCRVVESVRVEFKAGWNPKTTGPQVLKTICAFANDLQSLNGGYIVLGVQETDGRAALPAAGLTPDQLAAAQEVDTGQLQQNRSRLPAGRVAGDRG